MPYVVIRHYKGSAKLIDELEQRSGDVENLIRGISGFITYYLVRSEGGGFSVSVYEDRAGAEESVRAARDYLQQNLSDVSSEPPEVIEGQAVVSFSE
jgi:heme-degrading monooxygenase HmoA